MANAGEVAGNQNTDTSAPGRLGNQQGVTGAELTTQVQGFRQRLDAFAGANERIILQSRDLAQAFGAARQQVDGMLKAAQQQAQAERLTGIREALANQLNDELTAQGKRQAILGAIANLETQITNRLVDRKAGQAELAKLKRDELDITRQIAAETNRDSADLLQGEVAGYDQQLQILDERKARGEQVEKEMQALRSQRLQAAITAIELETQAEIQATGKVELANQRKQQRILALLRGEYLEQLRQQSDIEAATQSHYGRLDAMAQNRVGGARSPLRSLDETFSSDPGTSFEVGAFDLNQPLKKKRVPTPAEFARRYNFDPQLVQGVYNVGQGAAPATNIQNTTTVNFYVDGQARSDPAHKIAEEALRIANERMRQQRLIRTDQAPDVFRNKEAS